MALSIATSTALDLSRMPAPDIVEPIGYEAIFAAMRADLVTRAPTLTNLLDSDPAIKILQVAAYRETVLRQQFNDRARGLLLAYASATNLDHLAILFGVTRLELTPANVVTGAAAIMESDDDLRTRVLLAPDSYSVAGPESAYVFHARSASGDVLDASATSPAPGEVIVSVLSRLDNGTAAPALIAAVAAIVNDDEVRPLTDLVTVQSATIVTYAISANLYLYAGPDAALILANARASLDAWLLTVKRLGRDVTRSAISAKLHVEGVQRVELVTPAADLVMTKLQAGHVDAIALTNAGIGE